MAQITRSTKIGGGTTLSANTLARAADVETDALTLFNAHNNHDTGNSKWQIGSFENSSSTVLIANNSTGTNNIFEARDNGTAVLTVADGGAVTATGALSVGSVSSVLKGPDGSASAPTYSFSTSGNDDNGMFLSAANTVAFSAAGTQRLSISSSAITAALNLAMGSNKVTGLAAGSAAGESVRYEQLKVLQVVSATVTTAFSSTSATFVDTNLTASITPVNTSNKVLVIATGSGRISANGQAAFFGLERNSTDITTTDGQIKLNSSAAGIYWAGCTFVRLDSPASTSAVTYTVRVRNSDGATAAHFGDGVQAQDIVLIEINGI